MKDKQAVIERLYALANGAKPKGDAVHNGICRDIFNNFGEPACERISDIAKFWENAHPLGTVWCSNPGNWGTERRTFAAFLACWLETEL